MYQKDISFSLKSSASALNNNLCAFHESAKKLSFAVIHKSTVNVGTLLADGSSSSRQVSCKDVEGTIVSKAMVLQARWVTIGSRYLFVITTQTGIQVFDVDGTALVFWHGFPIENNELVSAAFACGIAGCGDNCLCIGTHDGSILIFDVPAEENNITYARTIEGHTTAISDLHSHKQVLGSADNSGAINVWNGENSLEKMHSFQSYGSSCTSIRLWETFLMAAYGSGHLRVFNLKSGDIMAEVAAHARWITAIDVAPDSGLALSVSEDSFLRVWQLGDGINSSIVHKFSESVTDSQLCGGCFTKSNGSVLGITVYDMPEVIFYRM